MPVIDPVTWVTAGPPSAITTTLMHPAVAARTKPPRSTATVERENVRV